MCKRQTTLWAVAALVGWLVLPGITAADKPEFRSFSGSTTRNLDCSTKAKLFPDINLAFFTEGFSTGDGSENSIRCTAKVRDGGKGRKGVKVTLGGEIVRLDDTDITVVSLPRKSKKTDKNGDLLLDFPLGDLPDDDLAVFIEGTFATKKRIDSAKVDCAARNRMPCQVDSHTACLQKNRFRVTADIAGETALLFSSSLQEAIFFVPPFDLLVRVLKRCDNNDHYWVFRDPFTNVEYDLTVTDTETGTTRHYENELGQVAQAITDTSAFATCP